MHKPEFKPGQPADRVSTREGYDRWAEIYDAEDNPLIALEEPLVAAALGDIRGLDVLDLGCGTGRHTLRLAQAGARVTAVDFAEGMVAKAAGKPGWERVRFVHHDVTTPLPLPNASFDRVCTFLVLDHIADVDAFFRECRRVCRPAGELLATVMHPAMMLRGILAHFRDPATGRDVCPESAANQVSTYVMAALRAGWQIIGLSEHAVDETHAARSARAAKYLGWPMLLILRARPSPPPHSA